jgi:hypothetical protein
LPSWRRHAIVEQSIAVEAGIKSGHIMSTVREHIGEQYPDVSVSSGNQ